MMRPAMPESVLIDLSHTCHTQARTGIQRVARSLYATLGDSAVPITHDPYAGTWRALEIWERAALDADVPAASRGPRWPVTARVRGLIRRFARGVRAPIVPGNSRGVVVPEVFSPGVARALPDLLGLTRGPRVALFHDAIALKFPELTPVKTVARFPAYLVELLQFDGIAAVSEDSRASLLDYWRWLGASDAPEVVTLSPGLAPMEFQAAPRPAPAVPVVLSVGSIEGRKNHGALLDACERLWNAGHRFTLHLVGLAHPQTGAAALAKIRALIEAGRPVRYDGAVSDEVLAAAYAGCQFTVYPSLIEGFGLPVIESLAHGKPCICSARGAIGESARGGGCVMLPSPDADSLAEAIGRLLNMPGEREALATAARGRRFRTWPQYADELLAWMQGLRRRG